MDQRRLWRTIIVLYALHILLLASLYYLPFFIGWQNKTFEVPRSILDSSLYIAQFQLLGVFWAIAQFSWRTKTLLFLVGIVLLSLMHVGIAIPFTTKNYTTTQLAGDVLDSVGPCLVESIVLAILLFASCLFSGDLASKPPTTPHQISIWGLFCMTTFAAIGVFALKYCGALMMETKDFVWLLMQYTVRALLAASCVWVMFAAKRQWIGGVCWVAAFSIATMNPTPGVTAMGYWVYPTLLITQSFWLCSTFAVFRFYGYRLHRFDPLQAVLPAQ